MPTRKWEHDHLSFTSFPSSIKSINDTEKPNRNVLEVIDGIEEGDEIGVESQMKVENVFGNAQAQVGIRDENNNRLLALFPGIEGTRDWGLVSGEKTAPAGADNIRIMAKGGRPPEAEQVALTWFDDYRVYVNGKLVFEDKFSNWTPYLVGTGLAGVVGLAYSKHAGWW